MADEKEAPVEKTDHTQELSGLWDQVASGKGDAEIPEQTEVKETPKEETKPETEEKPKEATQEEKPPVEKPTSAETSPAEEDKELTQGEKRHLGRKVKEQYELLQKQGEELRQMRETLAQLTTKPAEKPEAEVPEVIATPDDVERVIQAREERAIKQKADYEKSYLAQINSLKPSDQDSEIVTHDEVVAEMIQNFNLMHDIKNPFADARVNYSEAKAALLKKKFSSNKPKLPQRDAPEKAPIPPAASTTRETSKTYALPKLEDDAKSYLSYLANKKGKSVEEVAKEAGL